MFCSKCGAEVKEGAKFCPKCGNPTPDFNADDVTPAEQEESTLNFIPSEEEQASIYDASLIEEPKKSHKGLIIGFIVFLVAVIGVCLALFFTGYLMPAKMMVGRAVGNGKDNFIQEYKKGYDATQEAYKDINGDMKMSMKVTLGDQTKALIRSAVGVDCSWLDSANLNANLDVQKEQVGVEMTGNINDTDITTVGVIFDANSEQAYVMDSDILQDRAIVTDVDLNSKALTDALSNYVDTLENSADSLPTPEEMDKIITKYSDILVKDLQDCKMKKGRDEITAGEVASKYHVVEITVDKKTAAQLTVDMINELQKDEDTKAVYKKMTSSQFATGAYASTFKDFDTFWDYVTDSLEDAKKEAQDKLDEIKKNPEANEDVATVNVYINNSCEVKGVRVEPIEEEGYFEFFTPEDGDERGLRIAMHDEDKMVFCFEGQGQEKKAKFNGEYQLTSDDKDILKLTVEDFDTKEFEKRHSKGKVIINLDSSVANDMSDPTMQMFALADYAITFDNQGLNGQIDFDILSGEDSLLKLNMTYAMENVDDMTIPANKLQLERLSDEEKVAFIKSLNLNNFVDNLGKAKVPAEYYQPITDLKDAIASGDDMELARALIALGGSGSVEGYEDDSLEGSEVSEDVAKERLKAFAKMPYDDFAEMYRMGEGKENASDEEVRQAYEFLQNLE